MFTYFACNFLILYIVIYKQVCYNKTIINFDNDFKLRVIPIFLILLF